jgi:antitoxin (DNA-binding transcriptional repressor) of toxin-antitoxin stability system
MGYLPVKDLKQGRRVWERLRAEKEIVITRDGEPCAILVGVQGQNVETSLNAIRRALFSDAVSRVRRRAVGLPDAKPAIEKAITASRRARRA